MERLWSATGLLLAAGFLAACSSEVQIEDGDDDGSGASSGSGTGVGTASGTGEAGAGGAAHYYAQQIEDACHAMCLSGCGKPSGCTDDCVSQFPNPLIECTNEIVELLQCLTKQGDTLECPSTSQTCEDRWLAYLFCQNPLACGSTSAGLQCEPSSNGSSCSCTEGCAEGHVAGASCTYDYEAETERCDCSFDGVVVGQCENFFQSSCDIQSTACCAPFWR